MIFCVISWNPVSPSPKRAQRVKLKMCNTPIRENRASIPCSYQTKEIARSLKRGQQTYDSLLRCMVEQYEPDAGSNRRDGE